MHILYPMLYSLTWYLCGLSVAEDSQEVENGGEEFCPAHYACYLQYIHNMHMHT